MRRCLKVDSGYFEDESVCVVIVEMLLLLLLNSILDKPILFGCVGNESGGISKISTTSECSFRPPYPPPPPKNIFCLLIMLMQHIVYRPFSGQLFIKNSGQLFINQILIKPPTNSSVRIITYSSQIIIYL
jgi:hypothetical protein